MTNPFAQQTKPAAPAQAAPWGGGGAAQPTAFGNASGGAPARQAPGADEFGQGGGGGGKFPTPTQLFGALIAFDTSTATYAMVPDRFNGGALKERMEVDTVIVDGPSAGQYLGMWWSQAPIVKSVKSAEKRGQRYILGRLRRVPTGDTRKDYGIETADQLDAKLASMSATDPKIPWAWALLDHTPAEAAQAAAFFATL